MKQSIRQVQLFFVVCFVGLALGLVYWQLIRAADLLARDDNPRRVIAAQQIQRGRIVDRAGLILAETTIIQGVAERYYPHPEVAPAVGYYSLRYGTSNLEAAYEVRLRGEPRFPDGSGSRWLAALMHQPSRGYPLTTTLHLTGQQAAMQALAQVNTTGAIIVLEAESGAVRVLASYPSFNPNYLEADWESLVQDPAAPLLNRATQGVFPLGQMVRVPALLASLSDKTLPAALHTWQLDQELAFDLPTAAAQIPLDLPAKAPELALTPLQMALLGAAVLQDGLAPTPTLAAETRSSPLLPTRFLGPEVAAQAKSQLTTFSALASPEVTGNLPLSWQLTLTDNLVVVSVVATPSADVEAAQILAHATLQAMAE